MVSLFGGAVIGGTTYVGLERICLAFNVADEAFLDSASHAVEVMSQPDDGNDGGRVWWRSVHRGGEVTWTSTNPGEFRTEPPEPPCIVRDIPDGTPQVSLRAMLKGGVKSCEVLPPFSDRESEILDTAKRLLARTNERLPVDFYESVRSASSIDNRERYQALIDDLYKSYFVRLRCTIVDFSIAILFLQLQSALGFVEQEWRDNPWGYLRSYLGHMLRSEETRAKTIEILLSICKSEFASGRKNVAEALGGTMSAMPRRLMWANHKFFMVKAIQNGLEDGSIPREQMHPDPIVAEEAVACSYTGIQVGADFCIKHPDAFALDLFARCGPNLSELRRTTASQTSEIEPTFTRLFGQILAAQAMTCSADQAQIGEGIAELNRLAEQSINGSEEFEWSWLERALLNANRRIGNTEAVDALAKRIAVKLLLRKRLAGQPSQDDLG